jgi:hypothetical protein
MKFLLVQYYFLNKDTMLDMPIYCQKKLVTKFKASLQSFITLKLTYH